MDSYFLNGSNFKSGFTAGQIFIPNEASPGVPVGLPMPYTITKPNPRVDLYTAEFTLTPTSKTIVPLSQFVAGKIESLNGKTKVLVFDYSRVIAARITATSAPGTNVNIFISYYDIYGQIGFNQTVLDDVSTSTNPLAATLGLSSIFLTSDAPVTVTLKFTLTNIFELPITDNGILSQLLEVSAHADHELSGNVHDGLWINTLNDAEPYAFKWDGNYSFAQTTPITLTQNTPRPWFEFLKNGEAFDDNINKYTFTLLQNVYGLGNATQFNNASLDEENYLPEIGKVSSEIKYVYGQPNFTEGFTPWQG
jgi:hypothetical protein